MNDNNNNNQTENKYNYLKDIVCKDCSIVFNIFLNHSTGKFKISVRVLKKSGNKKFIIFENIYDKLFDNTLDALNVIVNILDKANKCINSSNLINILKNFSVKLQIVDNDRMD